MIRRVAADGRIETGGAFTPILRPRIVERIASAATQRIVLIIAPAGYGKSLALRQYLGTLAGVPHVRYDVHAENGTLLGFARGFADALLDVAPSARKSLSGAYEKSRSSNTPGLDLAMWMHAHIKTFTGVIAIDDLHIAENDPEISRFLVSLIERTKGRARWIIASRSSLDLPVGSWLAYGEMDLNIDEQDLRFTIDEARETAKASRVGVRDEELSEILTMTEGWPTALGFALRTSTRSVDLRNIAASTREMVYRYLAEQVYHSLDEDLQKVLQLIGYLPEIDLEVLHAAGYTTAKALVEELRDRVSFIYPDRPGVYRCHDLFRDFLQHQVELEGVFAAERMCLRAASALEKAGHIDAALNAYAQAKASADVLRILESTGFQLMEQGHGDALQSALDVLPQDLRATHPIVLAIRGLGEAHAGRYDRGESLLNRAMARSTDMRVSSTLAVRLALITANLGRDIVPLLAPFAQLALPAHLKAELFSLLAIGYANAGKHTEAQTAIDQAEMLADEMDEQAERAKILQRLGVASMWLQSPVPTIQQYLSRAVALAAEAGTFSVIARSYGALANVALLHEDDLTRTAWYAQQAMGAAGKAGDRLALQTALIQLMHIELTRGNAERLQKLERQFADVATSDTTRMALVIPVRALIAAWDERFDEAHRLLNTVLDRLAEENRAYFSAVCALLLVADQQTDRAGVLVRSTLALTERESASPHFRRELLIARSLLVIAEALGGRSTNAARILQRTRVESSPVVEAMREIASAVVRATRHAGVRDEILERVHVLDSIGYGGIGKLLHAAIDRCLQAQRQEPSEGVLTRAELAVLQALADGLGPKDIALETGRSVYTIQAHIQNVIKKLGCSGRNEAISLARRRGLLA